MPDERWVEVGERSIVVKKPGAEIDEATDHQPLPDDTWLRFKVPQSVVFIDEIPHNAPEKSSSGCCEKITGDASLACSETTVRA